MTGQSTPIVSSPGDKPPAWLDLSERIAKLGAGALICVYAVGFVVICIFETSFGIAAFDILRPRIITTGIAAVALTAVPVIVCLEYVKGEKSGRWTLVRDFAGYALVAYWLPTQLGAIFADTDSDQWDTRLFIAFVLFMVLFVGSVVIGRKLRWHKTVGTLGVIGPLLYLTWAIPHSPAGPRALGLWFVGIGGVSAFLRSPFGREELRYVRRDIGLYVARLLGCLVIYSGFVYPHLRPAFGGGAPVPVVLHLRSQLPTWNGQSIALRLIEETEAGYYVLDKPPTRHAVFVPRSEVLLVEFSPEPTESR
jgi:hypothetical protein